MTYLIYTIIEILFVYVSSKSLFQIIGSGNGLALKRWQAIIWANDD